MKKSPAIEWKSTWWRAAASLQVSSMRKVRDCCAMYSEVAIVCRNASEILCASSASAVRAWNATLMVPAASQVDRYVTLHLLRWWSRAELTSTMKISARASCNAARHHSRVPAPRGMLAGGRITPRPTRELAIASAERVATHALAVLKPLIVMGPRILYAGSVKMDARLAVYVAETTRAKMRRPRRSTLLAQSEAPYSTPPTMAEKLW
mmetsp:Transcript_11054/g.28547  ORF Transcript_11054/g.28547 Transcript_11054/m.28547 type:complete len:208 (+) Transcript_11054:257-880(+)